MHPKIRKKIAFENLNQEGRIASVERVAARFALMKNAENKPSWSLARPKHMGPAPSPGPRGLAIYGLRPSPLSSGKPLRDPANRAKGVSLHVA